MYNVFKFLWICTDAHTGLHVAVCTTNIHFNCVFPRAVTVDISLLTETMEANHPDVCQDEKLIGEVRIKILF